MKERNKKPARVPKTLKSDLMAKRNRALGPQTRKVLGRHYAAKYRVR